VSSLLSECGVADRQRDVDGQFDRGGNEEARRENRRKGISAEVKSKGGTMGEVTNDQVNLMLRLYEDRREPRLREAREWFFANFNVKDAEQALRICPLGSKENAHMRMVLSYWEMAASIVNRGLIDEDLFFENSGEQWAVWEQVKPVVASWRAMFSNPKFLANLEEQSKRLEAWREKNSPGSNEAIRKLRAQMQEMAQASKAKAAGN
jgi:hypothetical protein